MNHKYAPDMDAEDAFGISQTQIDRILELFDEGPEGFERAEEESRRCGLDARKFDDVLEWFGRIPPPAPEVSDEEAAEMAAERDAEDFYNANDSEDFSDWDMGLIGGDSDLMGER